MIGMPAIPGAASADSGWRVTPAVTVQEVFTDNSGLSSGGQQADAVSEIIPEITVSGETARSDLLVDYAPIFEHYDFGTSKDRIDQNLTGTGSFQPIPEHLSIDFNATASESGGNGNLGNLTSSTLIPANDRVLNYGGSIQPRFHSRLGGWATLDAFYRVGSFNASQEGQQGLGGSLSKDLLQRDANMVIGSGNDFGRLAVSLNFDHIDGSGTGPNSDSESDTDFIQFEYQLTHAYALIGSVGYQKIHYNSNGTTPGYNTEGLTWNAGARAAPNERSSLTATYGRQNGGYAPTVSMSYEIGPRTTVLASYVVSVQNQLQSSLQNLQYLTHDPFGNPIDSRTGLPFVDVNQTFASQEALFRDKVGTLSIGRQFVRSNISVTLTDESRGSVSGPASTDDALGGVATYSRELTPLLHGSLSLGYTDHRSSGVIVTGGEHSQVINTSLSFIYTISEKSFATITETYFQRISNNPSLSATNNQLTIGLKKVF